MCAIDILLYADRLHLTLLKEAVIDFLVEGKNIAIAFSQQLKFDDVPGHVIRYFRCPSLELETCGLPCNEGE